MKNLERFTKLKMDKDSFIVYPSGENKLRSGQFLFWDSRNVILNLFDEKDLYQKRAGSIIERPWISHAEFFEK
jgi:hypothetical protein